MLPTLRVALLFMLCCTLLLHPAAAHAATKLWLPTPPGERWKVIQGYGCGTHSGGDQHALDLVNADGRTYGAPVRAAADGTVLIWVGGSGTLILSHGGGFYTQYTHMASATSTRPGAAFKRGDVIGTVGDRATPGTPHLHFMAFTAKGAYASNRKTVPLAFAEGYDLPWVGGCNQHGGKVMTASGQEGSAAPGLAVHTTAEANRWYNSDVEFEISGAGAARGYANAWNKDPDAEAPQFQAMGVNVLHLTEAGEGLNTLHVRGWDAAGTPTDTTFGPIGYDITPPVQAKATAPITITANTTATLTWQPAEDRASGVAGYKVYVGSAADGTSDWFVKQPHTATPPLTPGRFLLRVQPVDFAGNTGAWTTIGDIVSEEAKK